VVGGVKMKKYRIFALDNSLFRDNITDFEVVAENLQQAYCIAKSKCSEHGWKLIEIVYLGEVE